MAMGAIASRLRVGLRSAKRLRLWRRSVPFYQQLSAAECGAACLRMILGYHGRYVPQEEMRSACAIGRDGANAALLLDVARRYGLKTSFDTALAEADLVDAPCPAILHWKMNHFVILERYKRGRYALIMDPALGPYRVTISQLADSFTGVALFFLPSEAFRPCREGRAASLRPFVGLARKSVRPLLLILLMTAAAQAIGILGAAVAQAMIDEGVAGRDEALILTLAGAMCISAAVHAALTYLRARLLLSVRTVLDSEMASHFFSYLLSLRLSFFEQRSSGDLMLRLAGNMAIRDLLSVRVIGAALDLILVVALAAMLATISPAFAAVIFLLAALRAAVVIGFRKRRSQSLRLQLSAQSLAQMCGLEILSGISTVKATAEEARCLNQWRRQFINSLNSTIKVGEVDAWIDSILAFLTVVSPAVVLAFCARAVVLGQMSLGSMVACASLATLILNSLASLTSVWDGWIVAARHLERMRDVLDSRPERVGGRRLPARPSRSIRLESVSFSYTSNSPEVLRAISLTVPPGSFAAIVGPSGSGKTTLAKILLGLYCPTRGRVLVDGEPLEELDLRCFRQEVGAVVQGVYVQSGSLRSVISGGDSSIMLSDVIRAASLAQVHTDITAMPLGYDTVISEGGSNLSGGQRQRIVIARALLSQRSFLLFDEATSAMDSITEARVAEAVGSLACTRIVIAHRLSTVRNADRIFVLRDGMLVEEGTHAELMFRGSLYCDLVSQQGA